MINAQAPVLSKMADERGMGGRRKMKSGIIGVGERSIRNFFFEHPMATYAAALAYRGLFGLFPFLFILVVLLGALGISDFFDRAMDQARAQSSRVRSPATRTCGRAGSGTGPTAARDDRAGREASRRRLALLRGGCRVVVRLGGRTHPNRGFQRRLSGHRDTTLVETAVALPGLRSHPRARGDRLRRADADRAAVGGEHS